MTRPRATLLFGILSIVGAVGGLVAGASPWIGVPLVLIGVAAGIRAFRSTEARFAELEWFNDEVSALVAQSGAGNVYLKMVRSAIERGLTLEQAAARLRKAVEASPKDSEALAHLVAILALRLGRYSLDPMGTADPSRLAAFAEIRRLCRRGLELDPRNPTFYDAQGIVCDHEGDHPSARRQFELGSGFHKNAHWRIYMAVSWLWEGKPREAMAEIALAEAAGVSRWQLPFYKGRALAQLGRYDEALRYLTRASAQRNRPHWEERVEVRRIYGLQGRYFRALTRTFADLPANAAISWRRALFEVAAAAGMLLLSMIQSISRGLWLLTKHWPAIAARQRRIFGAERMEVEKGSIFLQAGLPEAALHHLTAAYRVDPHRALTCSYLAAAMAYLRRREEAQEYARRSVVLDPQDLVVAQNAVMIERWAQEERQRDVAG